MKKVIVLTIATLLLIFAPLSALGAGGIGIYGGVSVGAASTSAAGKVELATDAETVAGTDTGKAVTPANIASFFAYQTIYIPGSAMTPNTTAGDTVSWGLKAVAVSDNDALDVAYGTEQVVSDTLLADNGGDLQVSGATPAITVGGTPALGDLVFFKAFRDTSGTDDMTEDAWLFGVLIQYKVTNTVAAW